VDSALSYGSYLTQQYCHSEKRNPLNFYWICIFTFQISLVYAVMNIMTAEEYKNVVYSIAVCFFTFFAALLL
jgi:hypothetical protein